MKFLKKIFSRKENPIKSIDDFWNWFVIHEQNFHQVVKQHENIELEFLDKIAHQLDQLREGIFYLTGMHNENQAELILTPDGNLKNVALIEELIKNAPSLDNWIFTALKPELSIADTAIRMGEYEFNSSNLFFYSTVDEDYPDEINITIIHAEWTEENKNNIEVGIHIFLDNYLGELKFMSTIDTIHVSGKKTPDQDLVPISKLKEYIRWREKEFVEKYESVIYDSSNATHSILEFDYNDGGFGIANINTEILKWDNQASHPWLCLVEINYTEESTNGMPNKTAQEMLEELESQLEEMLKERDGYINIGRLTAKKKRTIYFACKDFRKPSNVCYKLKTSYTNQLTLEFDLYKDKYWKTFKKFMVR